MSNSPSPWQRLIQSAIDGLMNRSGRFKRTLGGIHDIVVAGVALFVSYASPFGFWQTFAIPGLWFRITAFCAVAAIVFYAFALNRGSWRYASLFDVMAIGKACLTLIVLNAAGNFLYDRGAYMPRAQPIVLFALLATFLMGSRLLVRLMKEGRLLSLRPRVTSADARPILIYGVTPETELFLRGLHAEPSRKIRAVALLDDSTAHRRTRVQGVKVVGGLGHLGLVLARNRERDVNIQELVVGDPAVSPAQLSQIVQIAASHGLSITRLPVLTATYDLTEDFQPKPINLTDLLARPEVPLDTVEIARMIDGKCVAISGAGGSIGSELARQAARYNAKQVILIDNAENSLNTISQELIGQIGASRIRILIADVRDRDRIAGLLKACAPDVLFHAAAIKQVPLAELNPLETIKTNVLGTRNIADAAVAAGVRYVVLISTDKAVNPTSIMGATKRIAEAYCQAMDVASENTRFTIVRFGNVMGSNGSVIPLFQQQISQGGPLTVTHPDVVRYFMSIGEAVRLVLYASCKTQQSPTDRGNILVLEMGTPVKISDLATKMIQLAGLQPGVDIDIRYVGLRPGEKLVEELYTASETVSSSSEGGYKIVKSMIADKRFLDRFILELQSTADKEDGAGALRLVKRIVPEYGPLIEGAANGRSADSAQPS